MKKTTKTIILSIVSAVITAASVTVFLRKRQKLKLRKETMRNI